jgi:hypothetical protein
MSSFNYIWTKNLKLKYNCPYTVEWAYRHDIINDTIQKLNSIHVRLKMTQEKGRNM